MRLPTIAPFLALILLLGGVPFALGCEDDGGFENAGEEIDEGIDETEDELE